MGSRSVSLRPTTVVLRAVFGNRELRRIELAFAAFNAAEWSTWIAMIVFAYGEGGATTAGIVALAQLVPAAVFAPFASGLADRFPPGRVLACGYAAQAVALGATGGALLAAADPLLVYVLGAVPATLLTLSRPSQAALTPSLARTPSDLTAVNVVSGWIESASVLVAPALAGVALDRFGGAGTVFVAAAVMLALAAALVAPIPGPAPLVRGHAEPSTGVFALLRQERTARILLLLLAAQYVAIGALDVLYPELAVVVLGQSEGWAGYLNAAFGLGGTLGIVVTATLVGRRRLAPPLAAGLGLWCASFVVLAVAPSAAGALLLIAVGGVGRIVVDVAGRTLLQRVAPTDLLARVFGVLEGLSMAGLAAGSILAPALVALGGAKLALVGVALLLPLGALITGRRLLALDAHASVPVVEIALLRSISMFAPLGPAAIESLARSLERVDVGPGFTVITEGETGDRYYVIGEGKVEIVRDGRVVDTLGRGSGFGEIALLRDVPRTATCTTVEPTTLYVLEKGDFLEALTGHPAAHTEAHRIADRLLPAS